MRTPPTNWTTLMAQPHDTETRVDINNVSYYGFSAATNSGIWELNTTSALFDRFSVGNCYSSTINIVLVNPQTIPTMAQMDVYVRLTNGTLTTDWVRKGIYFIDTREWDAQHEFLTITGYDAMLKAEQPYLVAGEIGQFPKTDSVVVGEICTRLGVTLDNRTVIDKAYQVQMPAVSSDGSDSDSVRSVLGWIGAMYGGNWIITDEGKLRLVCMNAETYYLADESMNIITIGGDSIIV